MRMRSGFVGLAVVVCLLACAGPAIGAEGAPMNNQDVIKLVKAKLPEKTVLMAVQSATPNFDTSADGIIKLTAAGVPNAVVQAVIKAQSGGGEGAASVPSGSASLAPHLDKGAFNPEEVILVDSGQQTAMKYLVPTTHSGARALGFGGYATYAVLRGTEAHQRTHSDLPSFIVEVPERAQTESYVTIAHLAVRRNGTREIMVGGGYVTFESSIAHDRIVPFKSEKLSDQSRAQSGFILYEVTPEKTLPAGEYAVILDNSAAPVVGFFSHVTSSYFDFGVGG
jgi:hypothetical protein